MRVRLGGSFFWTSLALERGKSPRDALEGQHKWGRRAGQPSTGQCTAITGETRKEYWDGPLGDLKPTVAGLWPLNLSTLSSGCPVERVPA